MSSKSFFNSEINNYNNLSVEIIEKWINLEIERIEKRITKDFTWLNQLTTDFPSSATMERKFIEILLENKTILDTLRYVKKDLRSLDYKIENNPLFMSKKSYEVKK